jgi:excinuclease UvrABC nuclease subunit
MPGYVERVRAAWAFAAEDSGAIVESARGAMRAAAREMRFEDAARLKRRIESAERWRTLRRPMVRRERDLNHLLSIPVTRRKAYKLCLFRAGALVFSDMLSGRGSADKAAAWLEGALAAPQIVGARQRMEQTWLLAHLLERAERERVAIVALRDCATAAELLEAARAARELASKKPDAPTAAPPENEEGCEP